jgi:peptide/nickel transport system ATP-binding protein
MAEAPLLRVEGLARYFDVSPPLLNRIVERRGRVILKAVDGVDFTIGRGDTFSLVGESGCGKSTVARVIVGLYAPTRGRVVFDGTDLASLTSRA